MNESNQTDIVDVLMFEAGRKDATVTIKRLQAEIARLRAAACRWVPVSERLPNEGKKVLALVCNEEKICYWINVRCTEFEPPMWTEKKIWFTENGIGCSPTLWLDGVPPPPAGEKGAAR